VGNGQVTSLTLKFRINSRGSGAGLRKEFEYIEVAIKYLRNRKISAQRRKLQWVNG
jgi:hypothetical protein